jgi:hypothetical protein
MRIGEPPGVHRDIVPRGVANAPAEGRRDRRQEGLRRQRFRLLDHPFLVAGEPRIAVHPIELERHPMRAKVSLLEHIGPDAAKSRDSSSRDVVRPAIAEQQDIGDLVLAQEIIEKTRPVTKAAAEIGRLLRPVDLVTRADIDSLDLHSPLAHDGRELMQQRSWRAL